jgi:hypothetical protein
VHDAAGGCGRRQVPGGPVRNLKLKLRYVTLCHVTLCYVTDHQHGFVLGVVP